MNFQHLFTYLLSLLVISQLVACSHEDPSTTQQTPALQVAAVTVAQVTQETASNQIELVGTVESALQAEISSKISGNILSMSVELGSEIQKGDLLIELSAGEISAKLQQAAAQLEQAKRNLEREEKLLKKNAATPETVKSLKDGVRIAEAAFLESQTMLNYTKISAPFDGIITGKPANTGDLATPGKPLLRIEGKDKLQIVTDIPEAMVPAIQLGDRLKAHIPAIDITLFGRVTEISPTADPTSRTTPIKMTIPVQPHLRSGQFARVALKQNEELTLAIPRSSVLAYGQLERVFVVTDDRAQLRLVRTGSSLENKNGDELIEVLSGLEAGDTVVVTGNSTLQTGQPLEIR